MQIWCSFGSACPVSFKLNQLTIQEKLLPQLRLFRFNEKNSNNLGFWEPVAFQIKSFASEKKSKKDWYGVLLSRNFSSSTLKDSSIKYPCSAQDMYEISYFSKGNKKALYLFDCRDKIPSEKKSKPSVIHNKNKILTEYYSYEYENKNKLLFKNLFLNKNDNSPLKVAIKSNQTIVANFKNFFTLEFDKNDFHVNEIFNLAGNIGVYSRLNFLLKFLGLKIDLDLITDIYFYNEGLYTPMYLNMPVDAPKYLNNGSGIIYSWINTSNFRWDLNSSKIPSVRDLPNFLTSKYIDHIYCSSFNKYCSFYIKGISKNQNLFINFKIPKKLVKKGFYPVLFSSYSDLSDFLGRQISVDKKEKSLRTGFYFESSNLSKGSHDWLLSIDIRNPSKYVNLVCGELTNFAYITKNRLK